MDVLVAVVVVVVVIDATLHCLHMNDTFTELCYMENTLCLKKVPTF